MWMAALAFSLTFFGTVQAQSQSHAIPSGQEELMLDMLGRGAELPDGCELSGITTAREVIVATYSCGERRPVLELRHSETALDEGLRTTKFVVRADGDSVPSLLPAVAPIIERHEASFQWMALSVPPGSLGRTPSASAEFGWTKAATAALLGLAMSLALIGSFAWAERRDEVRRPRTGKGEPTTPLGDCPGSAENTSRSA